MLSLSKASKVLRSAVPSAIKRSSSVVTSSKTNYALPKTPEEQIRQVRKYFEAKEKAGLSFTEIAKRCQLTNAFVANVFFGRARLDDETAMKIKKAVPALTDEDIASMKRTPMRTFDERQFQDPTCHRIQEAVSEYAEAIKAVITEDFGDGNMSAICMYVQVEKFVGPEGEQRVVIKFNGKFLPHVIQNARALKKMKISD